MSREGKEHPVSFISSPKNWLLLVIITFIQTINWYRRFSWLSAVCGCYSRQAFQLNSTWSPPQLPSLNGGHSTDVDVEVFSPGASSKEKSCVLRSVSPTSYSSTLTRNQSANKRGEMLTLKQKNPSGEDNAKEGGRVEHFHPPGWILHDRFISDVWFLRIPTLPTTFQRKQQSTHHLPSSA